MSLQTGKPDPHHNRIVKTVAVETQAFYVFLDSENEIYYHVSDPNHQYPENFNKVNSKIRRLEVLVLSHMNGHEQAIFNFLLANNLGEVLEEDTIDQSWENLNQIESDINLIVNTQQKKFFSYGTNLSLLIVLVTILLLHLNKEYIISITNADTFDTLFCSLFGGIGALIFNYSKTKKYVSERVIGNFHHFLDGGLRILYGVIYAVIVILGIKSGMVMNFVNNNSTYLLAFLGVIAGASDTFIIAILKSVEQKSNEDKDKNNS